MQSTKRSVFPLKKSIALIMALSVLVCGVFAACSSKKTDGQNSAADTTQAGLANADTEFGTEINKDGKEVDVVYEKDKKGKTVAYEIDKNGEKVTDKNGKEVTVPIRETTTKKGETSTKKNNGGKGETPTNGPTTPQTTDNKGETTGKELTTIEASKDKVPSTNASGKKVIFNQQDLERIAAMLEVPGLYKFSYENKDGVSAEMATHVAVWRAPAFPPAPLCWTCSNTTARRWSTLRATATQRQKKRTSTTLSITAIRTACSPSPKARLSSSP